MRWPLINPPNGWRGFLADVAVVVIGVILALIAQEFAQSLQWQTDVAAQRGALRAMAEDNLKVIAFRRFQEPCIQRRLAELQTVFRLHHENRPIRFSGPIGLPYKWGSDRSAWNIALSDASLSHMPLAERRRFGNAVNVYDNIDALMKQEYAVWLRLQPLDHPELLEAEDWPLLRQAFGEEDALDARINGVVDEALTSNNLGLPVPKITHKDVPTEEEWGNAFCRPLLPSERQ
ncbi:MAG: hypothetical protein ABI853_02625 [Sphingomicrobium sp.]